MSDIKLVDLIDRLREELTEASLRADNQDDDIAFDVEDATVEIAFHVQSSVKAGGKLKFMVVELGADGTTSTGHAHKMSLKLKPKKRTADGTDEYVEVSETDVRKPD